MIKKIFNTIYTGTQKTMKIFWDEMRMVFTDAGVVIFFFVVPILYPVLYSWIYNNETCRDVPTVIVDDSHSGLSREFIRRIDAAPGAKVLSYANNMQEAKNVMMHQACRGIVHIPASFAQDINSNRQTTVGLYVDMSGFLYYKSLSLALTDVSLDMGRDITIKKLGAYTSRDEELSTAAIKTEPVAMFNPTEGYGAYLLPAVLIMVLQQTLLLGIGLSAGTARERNKYMTLVPARESYHNPLRIVFGKGLVYFLIYMILGAYVTMVVPHLFHFLQLASAYHVILILIPYILACIFFGMTMSCIMRHRENVILFIVFTSVPLLFLTGVVWPSSAIPGYWKTISYLFPSTFGVDAFVKLNSLGAELGDVANDFIAMWIQTGAYFLIASFVYHRQIQRSKKLARMENE